MSNSGSQMFGRMKFFIGGLIIVTAVVYLIASSTQESAQYFLTIEELITKGDSIVGRNVRISGAIVGESIQYDPQTLDLRFIVADVPADNKEIEAQGGLANVLHAAVTDPTRERIQVVYNGPKPDLLRNEAQAIMTGHMSSDGVFYADELLLKCPTRYEEAIPQQSSG
ncbi:MAG: cytochrome c maturation protein CcmE [Chloroflexota bacterium]